jgi:F0F1-type ATP synthase epsilon subunit
MSQSQPKTATKSGAKTMHIKIYAPFKIYYDDQANSISAVNRVGPFDILQGHHNFISLLMPGEITVRADSKDDFKMKINRGVIHVKADEVKVFLDV